jgi:hypothetical protein
MRAALPIAGYACRVSGLAKMVAMSIAAENHYCKLNAAAQFELKFSLPIQHPELGRPTLKPTPNVRIDNRTR